MVIDRNGVESDPNTCTDVFVLVPGSLSKTAIENFVLYCLLALLVLIILLGLALLWKQRVVDKVSFSGLCSKRESFSFLALVPLTSQKRYLARLRQRGKSTALKTLDEMESLMLGEDGLPEDANPQDNAQAPGPAQPDQSTQPDQPTQPSQPSQAPLEQSGQWPEGEEVEGEEEDEDESMFDPLPADRQILCKSASFPVASPSC